MKSSTMTWIIISVFMLISFVSVAQLSKSSGDKPKFPGWVSDKGYWVVESNKLSPHDHTVSFYDNENNLIYAEKLSGVRLDPEKKKVKMKLKKILETAVLAHEKNKELGQGANDLSLVSSMFR